MCLGEGRGLSRSQESHLHWRQHDTRLPAQVQAHFNPLAVCGVGVSVEVTLKDLKQGLCKSMINSKKTKRSAVST